MWCVYSTKCSAVAILWFVIEYASHLMGVCLIDRIFRCRNSLVCGWMSNSAAAMYDRKCADHATAVN
jgi:hypothetical protein